MGRNRASRTERPTEGMRFLTISSDSSSEIPIGESFFRSLVEDGLEALVVSRTDATIIYVNPSASQILRRESGEMLGATLADFANPDDIAELSAMATAALSSGKMTRSFTVATPGHRARIASWIPRNSSRSA